MKFRLVDLEEDGETQDVEIESSETCEFCGEESGQLFRNCDMNEHVCFDCVKRLYAMLPPLKLEDHKPIADTEDRKQIERVNVNRSGVFTLYILASKINEIINYLNSNEKPMEHSHSYPLIRELSDKRTELAGAGKGDA